MQLDFKLENSWSKYLNDELNSSYMKDLKIFLESELNSGKIIYPEKSKYFEALNLTAFDKVKVVIIGQDPYHGPGQAHGLSFSVLNGVKTPPSLVNIYKELNSDLGLKIPNNGHLINWAHEGVLLLNNVLTVEDGKAGSHHNRGWEIFTDKIISILNEEKNHLVFILWGAPAQKKGSSIDHNKHLVLTSPHPSPLSSYRGFFGSKPFSQTNQYLKKNKIKEINWDLVN